MSNHETPEPISGQLQRLLFSPKGGIEGLLLTRRSKVIQISLDPDTADAGALALGVGHPIELTASADHAPKTQHGAHAVYKLQRIAKLAGRPFQAKEDHLPIQGVVAAIHYAKHGEPNGVMLESGEFIHTRPHGMKALHLKVGSPVVAHGTVGMTVLGTTIVEAHEVNDVIIE